jgi:hypothetical protein
MVTIPAHSQLKVGTLAEILRDVASYLDLNASLTSCFVTEAPESASEVFAAYIAGKLQAGMISSFTMCSLITLGFSSGSKWQETASLIIVLSSGGESASAKMEKPSGLAW